MTASLFSPATKRTYIAFVGICGAAFLSACSSSSAPESTSAGPAPSATGTVSASGSTQTGPATTETSASGNTKQDSNPTATGAGIRPLNNSNSDMKTQRPSAPAQLAVTNVKVENHEGFDRVIFELQGTGEPGWFIDYTPTPVQQGSGSPIQFNGHTALNVNIDGTVYPFELGIENNNVGIIPGSGKTITEVHSVGTFEGRSQFVIGLNGNSRPYSVQRQADPSQITIDIAV